MNQDIIDKAVNIATKYAINGNPAKRVIWIPPSSASDSPEGSYAVELCGPISASDKMPWDE